MYRDLILLGLCSTWLPPPSPLILCSSFGHYAFPSFFRDPPGILSLLSCLPPAWVQTLGSPTWAAVPASAWLSGLQALPAQTHSLPYLWGCLLKNANQITSFHVQILTESFLKLFISHPNCGLSYSWLSRFIFMSSRSQDTTIFVVVWLKLLAHGQFLACRDHVSVTWSSSVPSAFRECNGWFCVSTCLGSSAHTFGQQLSWVFLWVCFGEASHLNNWTLSKADCSP